MQNLACTGARALTGVPVATAAVNASACDGTVRINCSTTAIAPIIGVIIAVIASPRAWHVLVECHKNIVELAGGVRWPTVVALDLEAIFVDIV